MHQQTRSRTTISNHSNGGVSHVIGGLSGLYPTMTDEIRPLHSSREPTTVLFFAGQGAGDRELKLGLRLARGCLMSVPFPPRKPPWRRTQPKRPTLRSGRSFAQREAASNDPDKLHEEGPLHENRVDSAAQSPRCAARCARSSRFPLYSPSGHISS